MDKLLSKKITFYSFMYSVIMIAGHANATVNFKNIFKVNAIDNIAWLIDSIISKVGVNQFFMMLSAFLLYYNIFEGSTKEKIKRRVKSLLIPWMLWNLIGVFAYHDFDQGIIHILTYYVTSRFCEALWFVQTLIVMLLFIPIFKRIFKIRIFSEIILAIVFIMGYYNWPMIQGLNIFPSGRLGREIMRSLYNLPAYCFGVYMGLNWSRIVLDEAYNKIRFLAKFGAAIALVLSFVLTNSFIAYVLIMMQGAFVWIIVDKKLFDFGMKWWMQISFYTYAIHNFVLYGIAKIVRMSGLFAKQFSSSTISATFALIWRLSLTCLAFLLVVLSAYILMKCTPNLYEKLSGGRLPKKID